MALHGDCVELDYFQELLKKHLTFWFVGNFLYIVGWKLCAEKCNNLFTSGLIYLGFRKQNAIFCRSQQAPPFRKCPHSYGKWNPIFSRFAYENSDFFYATLVYPRVTFIFSHQRIANGWFETYPFEKKHLHHSSKTQHRVKLGITQTLDVKIETHVQNLLGFADKTRGLGPLCHFLRIHLKAVCPEMK